MPKTRPAYEDDQAAQDTIAAGWKSRHALLRSVIRMYTAAIKTMKREIAAGLYEDPRAYGQERHRGRTQ